MEKLAQLIDILEQISNNAKDIRSYMDKAEAYLTSIHTKMAEIENLYRRVTIELLKIKDNN